MADHFIITVYFMITIISCYCSSLQPTTPNQKKIKKMKIQLVEFGQVSVFLGKCSEPSAML